MQTFALEASTPNNHFPHRLRPQPITEPSEFYQVGLVVLNAHHLDPG